jgi:hypothetical protein
MRRKQMLIEPAKKVKSQSRDGGVCEDIAV